MGRIFQHRHLDDAERMKVQRLVNKLRNGRLTAESLTRELVALGYERSSVEGYVSLVQSTIEPHEQPVPV